MPTVNKDIRKVFIEFLSLFLIKNITEKTISIQEDSSKNSMVKSYYRNYDGKNHQYKSVPSGSFCGNDIARDVFETSRFQVMRKLLSESGVVSVIYRALISSSFHWLYFQSNYVSQTEHDSGGDNCNYYGQ